MECFIILLRRSSTFLSVRASRSKATNHRYEGPRIKSVFSHVVVGVDIAMVVPTVRFWVDHDDIVGCSNLIEPPPV